MSKEDCPNRWENLEGSDEAGHCFDELLLLGCFVSGEADLGELKGWVMSEEGVKGDECFEAFDGEGLELGEVFDQWIGS